MKAWGEPPRRRADDPTIKPLRREVDRIPPPGRDAIHRALTALRNLGPGTADADLGDPMAAVIHRFLRSEGKRLNIARLLFHWRQESGQPTGLDPRVPWRYAPDGATPERYAAKSGADAHWRPLEAGLREADPAAYARRLVEPIAQIQTYELLHEVTTNKTQNDVADVLRGELRPVIERELALRVVGTDPWDDLFALWQLTRAPRTLEQMWWLATAIAFRYATLSRRVAGPLVGDGPFARKQLVSASAALASVLWQLRIYPSLVPELIHFVRDSRDDAGGWADPGQPADVLTTLVAADLLLAIDPDFDPRPTIGWFINAQEADGWWRALGPEVPWLTWAVADWLERAGKPFEERFRWPGSLRVDRDRRTQLPTYAWFVDLERGVAEVEGLAAARMDLAFIDLAGFGDFNTTFGQSMGDRVIESFGKALGRIEGVAALRDGGDEFVVVGPPTATDLYDKLEVFRHAWASEFESTYGEKSSVAPRILVRDRASYGRDLGRTREELGRRIGPFKKAHGAVPPEGVLERS